MKKYKLKKLLEQSKSENEMLEERVEEVLEIMEKLNNDLSQMRINKDKEIIRLENRIKELETTIRVLQNI